MAREGIQAVEAPTVLTQASLYDLAPVAAQMEPML